MTIISSKSRLANSPDDNISDIIQMMSNAMLVFDNHDRIVSYNKYFTSLVLSGEDFQIKQNFSQIATISATKKDENILSFVTRENGYDGSITFQIYQINKTFANCSIKPLQLPNSDSCYWFLTVNDTDAIEQELFIREQTIHAQYDNFPIPTYTWKRVGDDFILVNFNLAAKAITKNTIQEFRGKSYREVMAHRQETITYIEKCFASRKSFHKKMVYEYSAIDLRRELDVTYVFVEPDMVMIHTEDITDKLENIRELHKKEQRLKGIVTSLYKTAITLIDRDGVYLEAWADPLFEKATGITAKSLIGKNIIDFRAIFKNDTKDAFVVINEVLQTGKPQLFSYTFDSGNKTVCHDASIVPLRGQHGNTEGVVSYIRDVTDRKLAQMDLVKKEQRLEGIVTSLYKTAITIIDKNGTYIEAWADPLFEKTAGMPSKFLIGKTVSELKKIFSGDKPSVFDVLDQALLDKVLKEGKTKLLSYSFYSGNKKIYRESSLVPLLDQNGNIEGAVSYIRDVTDRKLAQIELEQNEEWLRSIVTSLHKSAIFVLDYEGNFLGAWADPNFEKQVGILASNLVGSNILDDNPEVFTKFPVNTLNGKLVANETPLTVEYLLETIKGNFWLSVSHSTLKSSASINSGVVVYIHDITDQKRAENRLIKSQERLRYYASQLTLAEERERRKLAVILHDVISQDLVTIKMQMELLLNQLEINLAKEKLPKLISMVSDAMHKTKTLTFDLSPPILYELGLSEALIWLFERFNGKLKIPCTFNNSETNLELDDDIKVLLFQIVQELLVNIMKYANASKVNGHLKESEQMLIITVSDDGQGFDPEAVTVVSDDFNHFGIFSIKERLKPFGGDMLIKSAPGKGCKTEIRIRPKSVRFT